MNSFQLVMNAKTEVATRPGATSGSRIRTNAPRRLEPSTIAASSSSFGIPSRNPRSVQTENGSTKVMYVTITPKKTYWSCVRWYRLSTTYSGMINPAWGSIWIPIIRTTKVFRPVKLYFASATAARNASAIDAATATPTMIRLFSTELQKYGRWIASRKWSIVGWIGNQVGFSRLMSSVGLNAVETIQ